LRSLREERVTRLDVTSANSTALRSQINRIKETISQILTGDKTLAERIRTLFREQGVRIMSFLTAIGLVISTIVLAITGGGGRGSSSPPAPTLPTNGGGVKEWIQNKLKSLGNMLAWLTDKAAGALPGIIGTIAKQLAEQ